MLDGTSIVHHIMTTATPDTCKRKPQHLLTHWLKKQQQKSPAETVILQHLLCLTSIHYWLIPPLHCQWIACVKPLSVQPERSPAVRGQGHKVASARGLDPHQTGRVGCVSAVRSSVISQLVWKLWYCHQLQSISWGSVPRADRHSWLCFGSEEFSYITTLVWKLSYCHQLQSISII